MLRYCEQCGNPLGEGVQYCNQCGAPAPVPSYSAASPQTVVEQKGVKTDTVVEPGRSHVQRETGSAGDEAARPASEPTPDSSSASGKGGWFAKLFKRKKAEPSKEAGADGSVGHGHSGQASDSPTVVGKKRQTAYLVRRKTGERLPLQCPSVVGKGSKATCLVAGNPGISREHLRVTEDAHGFLVENLSTTNGTWIDDRQLMLAEPRRIASGSVITMADEDFTFLAE